MMERFFDTAYLFDINPSDFHYINEAYIAIIAFLLLGILAFWLFKKRREFIKINKEQRYMLKRFAILDIVLAAIALVFLLFRTLDVDYFSMRIWLVMIFIITIVINMIAAVKAYLLREIQEIKAETPDQYAKYLPRKKKK